MVHEGEASPREQIQYSRVNLSLLDILHVFCPTENFGQILQKAADLVPLTASRF